MSSQLQDSHKQGSATPPPQADGVAQSLPLTVLVSDGSDAFFERVARCLSPLGARVMRAEAMPEFSGRLKPASGKQHVVAVVSVTALADERGWYGLSDVPVIWVNHRPHDRQTLDPLGGSRLLPVDFSDEDLHAMLQSVLPDAALPVFAPLRSGSVMVARSQTMIRLLDEVMAFAGSDHNVLIEGETGTGKELIAELVHQGHTRYSAGPLVSVNCGAIPDGLFESLFFGHIKGAFTGAQQAHRGYLEQSDGGTLFMDEVGELPLFQQVKLLRVLESGEVTRVGSETPVKLDFRLVAATNRNLREMVRKGDFRADLYYRLAVIEFKVPNLEERGATDKVAIFCTILARVVGASHDAEAVGPPAWLTERVAATYFPGNVRQLRNLAERAGVIYRQTGHWDTRLINQALDTVREMATAPPPVQRPADADERERILRELEKNGWQRKLTADNLGMSRKSLWEKIRKFGIVEPS